MNTKHLGELSGPMNVGGTRYYAGTPADKLNLTDDDYEFYVRRGHIVLKTAAARPTKASKAQAPAPAPAPDTAPAAAPDGPIDAPPPPAAPVDAAEDTAPPAKGGEKGGKDSIAERLRARTQAGMNAIK